MKELCPCKRCHAIPKVVEVTGLFYVQCTGQCKKRVYDKNDTEHKNPRTVTVKCDKWQPYEFLGSSRHSAIESWNDANTKKTLDEEE